MTISGVLYLLGLIIFSIAVGVETASSPIGFEILGFGCMVYGGMRRLVGDL